MGTQASPSQVVKREVINKTVEALKQLPKKPKQDFALREAICEMHHQIEEVLKRGYSLDEVAEILSGHGIAIKGATLKQYLKSIRQQKARKKAAGAAKQVKPGPKQEPKGQDLPVGELPKRGLGRKVGQFVEIPDRL